MKAKLIGHGIALLLCLGGLAVDAATPSVVAGAAYSAALATDGAIYAWGDYKAANMGYKQDQVFAHPNRLLSDGVEVAAGAYHTLARKADGSVWGWGYNNSGQLGIASFLQPRITAPQAIAGLPAVTALAAGSLHSLALAADGTVWSWGANSDGQLGNGDSSGLKLAAPAALAGLRNVVAISGGGGHSLALDADGMLWAWGNDFYGQLGDGATQPVYRPALVAGLPRLRAVAAGGFHTLALAEDGSVWSWGQNLFGQLGRNSASGGKPAAIAGLPKIRAIAAGNHHSLALAEDGGVWAWGEALAAGLAANGAAPSKLNLPKPMTIIAAGLAHSLAMDGDGLVWAWGGNSDGQLGDATFAARTASVLVVNENVDYALDLIPESPNTIPPDKVPPFFVKSQKIGDDNSLNLSVDINLKFPLVSKAANRFSADGPYNLYVCGIAPRSYPANLQSCGDITDPSVDVACRKYESSAWDVWNSKDPIWHYKSNLLGDVNGFTGQIELIAGAKVSAFKCGAFYVGLGTSDQEMLSEGRYRAIYSVPPN